MKTLVVSPVFPPARGGIETLAGNLARRLAGEVLVVALEPGPGAAVSDGGADDPPELRVIRLPNVPRGGRKSLLRLNAAAVRAGARFRPDVVLSMHVRASPACVLLSRLLRVPFVQYVHAKELREVPALSRLAVQGADRVISVSHYSRELAIAAGADPERVAVVFNGVDPRERRAEREAVPTMVTVSRLEDRYKGHDVVLSALPRIRSAVPDVRWVVVGDGSLRPELEEVARAAGVAEAVRFVGAVDDATRDGWLDRASVFVMPSRQPGGRRAGEGFGIVFVEAGAHGLPVVAGRVPGVVDAVLDGETGLLVDPTDPDAVAAAVVRTLTEPGLAEALGAAGVARSHELSWPNVASEVERRLAELTAAPVARPRLAWRLGWLRELILGPARAGD